MTREEEDAVFEAMWKKCQTDSTGVRLTTSPIWGKNLLRVFFDLGLEHGKKAALLKKDGAGLTEC